MRLNQVRARKITGLPAAPRRGAIAAVLLLCGGLGAFFPPAARAADHTADAAAKRRDARIALRAKQSATVGRIKAVKTQLRQARRSEEAIDAELAAIQARLRDTRRHLAYQKVHLQQAHQQQLQVAHALVISQRELQSRELQLGQRMAATYREGPVRYVSVVLGSRSMGEMVSRAQVVRTIVQYDSRLIAQISADRVQVERWKKQADAKAAEVAAQTQALGAEQDKQARDTQRERAVLAEAQARRAEFQQQLDDLEQDSETIASHLRALEETPIGHARSLITFTGSFMRPVSAPITSGFGMRFHPILHYSRLHAGVDFGAAWGTPIGAAAAGIVAFSGTMRGYGNVVVIDHGGGVSTLYAHCSSRQVYEGQAVRQGQIIAHVGATGLATGPHLHFEVRKNGTPVNPLGVL